MSHPSHYRSRSRASKADDNADASCSLAWCLPTGFNTPITYFYLAFFIVLLLHRQVRDDEMCRQKYGKDWDKVGPEIDQNLNI